MHSERDTTPDTLFAAFAEDDRVLDGDGMASANRSAFLGQGVVAVNVMGGPSSGRTSLVEATARFLTGRRAGVVLAGPTADAEARRLSRSGLPAHGITSRRSCHVEAGALDLALQEFAWRYLDYLFVENVSGLVSPAFHDLGEGARVVTLAVTEGALLPLRYPDVFRSADLVVVTKVDLLPFLADVSLDGIARSLACVMRRPAFVATSALTGQGIAEWGAWLENRRLRGRPSTLPSLEPSHMPAVLAMA